MQNLHDHHIRFRSGGGSNDPANRVTLCAFHHLRGVHADRVRCVGRAPDGLRRAWQGQVAASFEDNPIVQEIVAYIRADRKKSLCTPRDDAE